MNQKELVDAINKLKKEKNAVILVHNYQRKEIYEVADYIGDSLGLSIEASKTNAEVIVFCGVNFMAESAKILSPKKTVLIPAKEAQCPMSAMITGEQVKELRKKYPKAAVVCYVNTSAEVKAESDICCTSRNAVRVVNSMEEDEVIFVPDKHLANYVQMHTLKKIIPFEGYCYVHSQIPADFVKKAKEEHPDALVIAHPECTKEVLKLAHEIKSTEGMIELCKRNNKKEYIIVTEEGMINRLKKECPDKKFYGMQNVCFQMKKNNLQKVYDSLNEMKYKVEIPEEIRVRSKKALDKMIGVS